MQLDHPEWSNVIHMHLGFIKQRNCYGNLGIYVNHFSASRTRKQKEKTQQCVLLLPYSVSHSWVSEQTIQHQSKIPESSLSSRLRQQYFCASRITRKSVPIVPTWKELNIKSKTVLSKLSCFDSKSVCQMNWICNVCIDFFPSGTELWLTPPQKPRTPPLNISLFLKHRNPNGNFFDCNYRNESDKRSLIFLQEIEQLEKHH